MYIFTFANIMSLVQISYGAVVNSNVFKDSVMIMLGISGSVIIFFPKTYWS